jgi:hypothetical protein
MYCKVKVKGGRTRMLGIRTVVSSPFRIFRRYMLTSREPTESQMGGSRDQSRRPAACKNIEVFAILMLLLGGARPPVRHT